MSDCSLILMGTGSEKRICQGRLAWDRVWSWVFLGPSFVLCKVKILSCNVQSLWLVPKRG